MTRAGSSRPYFGDHFLSCFILTHFNEAQARVKILCHRVVLIAGAQVGTVLDAGPVLLTVLPAFAAFLLAAALLARLLARLFRLSAGAGRTLAFSMGTRNSFVVLPFALALPSGWETTVVVIVFQSLVELFGMVFYLWWLPHRLFKGAGETYTAHRG